MPSAQLTDLWGDLRDVWQSGQVQLPQVVRWSKDVADTKNGGARRQDTLAHSYSLTLLGLILLDTLKDHVSLDTHLTTTSLLVHDHGEGELARDILYDQKTEQGDLDEYLAFKKRFEALGSAYPFFERAFLVQFARKAPPSFPTDAQTVMKDLVETKFHECLFFDVVERFDYLLYALEQYVDRNNAHILARVLTRQMPHLHRLAEELPGFDTIWTPDIESMLQTFKDTHQHLL
jgi:5'-deoxynucleotidase YfbR-like HD superfamily hydrolase